MIHCPYCGSAMEDNSESCPRCKSLMVSSETPHSGSLPRWLHPLSALVLIVLASAALLAVELKPWGKGKTAALAPETNAIPAATDDDNGGASSSPATDKPAAPDPAADLYKQVNDYVANVKDTLAQADGVSQEIERLAQQNNKAQLGPMRDKQSQLQHFTNRLRSITPPPALTSAHTRLCNSQAVLARAYRSLSMYVETSDAKQLDRATRDLKSAKDAKDQAMAEITAYRDKIPAPAAPPPAPEPQPQPENPPPAAPPPSGPPPVQDPNPVNEPQTQPQPATEGGTPAEGSSTSSGNTAATPADGQPPEPPLVPDGDTSQPAPRRRRH